MEPLADPDESLPWPRKAIGWIVICVGVFAAAETTWTSLHIEEHKQDALPRSQDYYREFSPLQIILITMALMAGSGFSLWLCNRITKLNSKLLKILIGIAAMAGMVILPSSLKTYVREYSAIWVVTWWDGFMIVAVCLENIFPPRKKKRSLSAGERPKEVGWSPPPENNWWSKYN